MIKRILDFAQDPARLSVRLEQLVIERPGDARRTVPLADVAVLILAHPQVTCTQSVLAVLARLGGALVVCDSRSLPVGLMLPLVEHHAVAQRMAAQAAAPTPLKKRLWRQLVRAKIRAQAASLQALRGGDFGLRAMARQVRSGDPSNLEAQAARRYWKHLLPEGPFRRDPKRADENLLLNYGYAVLRAIVARAICATGLHPSLGLHHHHRENPYCLADDLMEPFRPLVDRAMVEFRAEQTPVNHLSPEAKTFLIERITGRVMVAGQQLTLFDAATSLASSLANACLSGKGVLKLPQW